MNFDQSPQRQEPIKDKWEEILYRFPKKLQGEFRTERPNPDQDDIEMFEPLILLESNPVEISIVELLEKNKDVIYRTPPDVFEEINKKYYKNELDEKKCHFHELKPNRLREYSKMPAETADPSVLLDGEIWFGTGRFIAALLRGDKSLRVWNLSKKQ